MTSAIKQQPTVVHDTFVLERTYPRTPEQVFAAFADPAKKRRWFAEAGSHEVEEFTMDFRVGGAERAQYRFKAGTQFEGVLLTSDGSYYDIVPNRRIVQASTMTFGGQRISAALVTIELMESGIGTDLICTHQAAYFEGSDGPDIRKAGWNALLDQLAAALA